MKYKIKFTTSQSERKMGHNEPLAVPVCLRERVRSCRSRESEQKCTNIYWWNCLAGNNSFYHGLRLGSAMLSRRQW